MGLPPTSPRFKFMYTHPVGASSNLVVPRRPPRQPSSPSTRSRSLELLDQQDQERRSVSSAVVQRPSLPRPRSRSLDDLLDEDANGEEQDKIQCDKSRECPSTSSEEDKVVPASEESQKESNAEAIEFNDEPRPVPRTKPKVPEAIEFKSETEDIRTSLNKDESDKEALPTRPPKPSRRSSSEEQSSTCSSKRYADQEHPMEEQRIRKTAQERLTQGGDENDDYNDNDKSTMLLKASRSCGAGLDSDGSVSSEYSGHRARARKSPGSLLSLPAGAEPKRKRNFMDKCVNKVRAFIKK